MANYIFLILLFCFVFGCECVPGLDTPKEITPQNSTNCLFVNGIEDNNNIYLETDEIKIAGKINYQKTELDIKKVKIGNYYLKIKGNDSTSVIYNSPINFRKNKQYIYCLAGIYYSILPLLIERDYSNNYSTELINLSGNNYPINITIISGADTLVQSLNRMSSMKLDLNNRKIDLLFINNQNSELEYNKSNIELSNYNLIVIKGNNYKNQKTMIVDVVNSNTPF